MYTRLVCGLPSAAVLIVGLLVSESALSSVVTVIGPYHFRANTGVNSAGINAGDTSRVGVFSATPNGAAGTTGTAVAPDGLTRDLVFTPNPLQPDRFVLGPDYSPARAGSWELTFTNGPDTTGPIATPDVLGVELMPFVRNVRLMGAGLSPTLSWELPADKLAAAGLNADYMSVWIRNLEDFSIVNPNNGKRSAAVIANTGAFDPGITSVTLDASTLVGTALEYGHRYSIQINMQDTRDGTRRLAQTKASSTAFFNFTPLADDPSGGAGILLPVVDPDGDGTGAPIFRFETDVSPGEVLYIDPYIAIGYDYATGVGDPNFASVLLPAIGDDLYQLWLWDGVDWVMHDVLAAGIEYFFDPGGVDRFRILGIETSAMLDPADPAAFVTGLTFTGAGRFTGTMQAVTALVAVPAPASTVLLLIGLAAMGRRRRTMT